MPIFVPTQGQGALYPLRAPQASQVNFNPLNTLGAASLVQRNRAMDMQQELQDYQKQKLDLAEKEFIAQNQREYFKMVTDAYDGYSSTRQAKTGNLQSSYGLDPTFYGNVIGEIDNQQQEQLRKGLSIVSTMKSADAIPQAASELTDHLTNSARDLKGNTQYQKYFRNQVAFNDLDDNLYNKRKAGEDINMFRYAQLQDRMTVKDDKSQNVRPSDFVPSQYLYNPEKGEKAIDETVKNMIEQKDFTRILDAGENYGDGVVPEGFIATVTGKTIKELDDAREKAFKNLRTNHDVRSMAEVLSLENGLTADENIKALIDNELITYERQIGDVITNFSLQNKPKAETTASRIPDIKEEITAAGYNPDPVGPQSEEEALRRIAQIRDGDDEGRLSVVEEDGRLKYQYQPKDESPITIAEYEKSNILTEGPITKEVTEDGVIFRDAKGRITPVPQQSQQTAPTQASPTTAPAQTTQQAAPAPEAEVSQDSAEINAVGAVHENLTDRQDSEGNVNNILPEKLDKNLGFYTNNPLNVKVGKNKPHITRYDSEGDGIYHAVYPDMKTGIQANIDTLKRYVTADSEGKPLNRAFAANLEKQGKTLEQATVKDLYKTWATGASEKNIATIARELEVAPDTLLGNIAVQDLFFAILKVENPTVFKELSEFRDTIFTPTQPPAPATTVEPTNRWAHRKK